MKDKLKSVLLKSLLALACLPLLVLFLMPKATQGSPSATTAGPALEALAEGTADSDPTQAATELAETEMTVPSEPAPSTLSPTLSPTPAPATASPEPTATATPKATKKPTAKPAATPKPEQPYTLPYVIYVEKGSHTITIYGKNDDGSYTRVVKQFLTATGSTPARTPTGTFTIRSKERWHKFGSATYAQYASSYRSGLYFHSPLYTAQDNNTLVVKSYRQIGTNATAGCMRTYTGAAYWIYENCAVGTRVEIVNGSPKGTGAGAPPAIADDATFDPTDPFPPVVATPAPEPTPSPTPEPTPPPTPEPTPPPTPEPTPPSTPEPTPTPTSAPTETSA